MKLREWTDRVSQSEDLTAEEAEQALEVILSEKTDDREIAGFLQALASKGESVGEIMGFARGMRRQSLQIRSFHPKIIDTAGTGGGADTFNVSTAAAFVIAGAGLPVAKHGNRAQTSRCGSADLLQALGVNIERPPEVAERSLNEIGICFMFAPRFHPAMKRVAPIRQSLTCRTIFNLLGPLTNPANAPYQLVGVYSPRLTARLAEALLGLNCRKAWVVHSHDGMDELSIGSPAGISQAWQGAVTSFDLDPEQLGFPPVPVSQLAGGSSRENAELVEGILRGKRRGPARDVVVLNAAAALHVAEEGSLPEMVRKAIESIDSEAAYEKLSQLTESYATP